MVEKLEGFEVSVERSCNDQGLLYGSVTQQDVAQLLQAAGFAVRPRDVRITQTIKRVDTYQVTIKPESDLEASVSLHVKADRPLEASRRGDAPVAEAPAAAAAAEGEAPAAAADAPAEGKKSKKAKKDASEEQPKAEAKGWGKGLPKDEPVVAAPPKREGRSKDDTGKGKKK